MHALSLPAASINIVNARQMDTWSSFSRPKSSTITIAFGISAIDNNNIEIQHKIQNIQSILSQKISCATE